MMKHTILLTGNAGFIGTYLTKLLLKEGNFVKGLDIQPRKDLLQNFIQIDGNILNNKVVRQNLIDVDTVIHLAAEHKDFGISKEEYFQVNEQGTKVLLEEASRAGVKKFIFYSSVAVYGAQSGTTEETVPNPNNYYGSSKLAAEKAVIKWAEENKNRTAIIIRPTVVFGANSKANIFRLIRQICDGRFIMVGNGGNIKSIAYVENLVEATYFLMNKCSVGTHIFNYADEPHLSTKELVFLIKKISGRKSNTIHIPLNLALAGGYLFDAFGKITGYDFPVTAARMRKFVMPTFHKAKKIREFGFMPKYSIEEGLKQHIDWYKMGREKIIKESDSSE